ncbi:hypothetical protein Dxin01_01540 [Deinococcus xinjiangensis]|uniref:NACHT domain-containing protein n=1 Tax=Deinococcus xinjiangensis TaxID=457454 RepID=A0ABP9VB02_9DEIO
MSKIIAPIPPHSKNRIESISDEVGELHPILRRLFRAMGYQAVEYTHGPTEQGADFVLTDFDPRLKNNKYIGVIAKTSRILGNTVDIENQIIQCSSRRFIENGKKEVRISGIFVVTTKSISHNAERSIHEKYATQSVDFFDRDRLVELINEYMPDFWYDIPSDLGEYLTYLRVKNEQNDKALSIISNKEVDYIKQDVVKFDEDFYSNRSRHRIVKRELVDLESEILDHKFIFMEGNIGSGKSKLLRRLIAYYSSPDSYKKHDTIPIFSTFRELFDSYNCDINNLIRESLSGISDSVNIHDKKILIVIDGFDEKILGYEERAKILGHFRDQSDYGKKHVLIASRYLFTNSVSPNALKTAKRYEVAPLSTKQLIKYMESICKSFNVHNRLLEDIKKSHLMKDIPRSPIAAIILAQLLQETGQDLPSNLTELYSKYIELALGRWDMQKGIRSQKEYDIIENVLMHFASECVDNQIQVTTIAGFKALIHKYCSSRQLGISENEIFDLISERSDIIVVNNSVNEVLFKHRSFAEFLYAKHMIRNQNYNVDSSAFNVYWTNIHFFSFGILKDAPTQLRRLYGITPKNDSEKFLKSIYISDYLMAAYQTPYNLIEEGVELAAKSYGELYFSITENKSELLNNLPKMVLLYIFQLMFRNNYNYDFLKNALESAGINIASSNLDFSPYSLFFLDTALIEEDREGNFKMLMDACGTAVPTDLALAIRHETKNDKTTYDAVKKNNKRVQRIINNKDSVISLSKLYDIPIKDLSVKGKVR